MDDEDCALAARGYRRHVVTTGAGAFWRITAPNGSSTAGVSQSPGSARREAAFAAFAASAIARVRARC